MGGLRCRMSILRNVNVSYACVAHNPQCHMSKSRKGYVPCHYMFSPYEACHYFLCHMSNLRIAYIALSMIGVGGRGGSRGGGGGSCGSGPPPLFFGGGGPNFIKRGKTLRMCTQYTVF